MRGKSLAVAAVCLALLAATAFSDDGDQAERLRAEAAAKVEAGKYGDALALYEQVLELGDPGPTVVAEAARCAFRGESYERARELATRSLDVDKGGFGAPSARRKMLSLVSEIDGILEREVKLRDTFVRKFVDGALRNLPRHQRCVSSSHLQRRKKSAFEKYALKDKYTCRHLWAFLNITAGERRVVTLNMWERYRDPRTVEERYNAILDVIRKEKPRWEKAYRHRTRDQTFELQEHTDEELEDRDGVPVRALVTSFCWDSSTSRKVDSTYSAQVRVSLPVGDEVHAEPGTWWSIVFFLDSGWFK